jgi:hypothetical protein
MTLLGLVFAAAKPPPSSAQLREGKNCPPSLTKQGSAWQMRFAWNTVVAHY